MPPKRQKIFSCPSCSLRVSGLEECCPRCGKVFEAATELECPFCGTLVNPTSASCPSCQIVYDELYRQTEERLWDKAVDKIIDELDEIARADAEDLVCQKCHSILERPNAKCAKCGFTASHEPVKPEPVQEAETASPDALEEESDVEAVCPLCDSVVSLDDPVCPHCGAEFVADEYDEDAIEDDRVFCPACYHEVDLKVSRCPYCGAEFDEGEDYGPLAPEDEEISGEVVQGSDGPTSPLSAQSRTGRGIITSVPTTRQPGDTEGLSNGASIVNGAGAINGKSRINGVGAINGKSRINGVHLTNGLGATNGRDMVNGTGLNIGEIAEMARAPFGRKGVAVLVAAVTIISVFAYLSLSRVESPFNADGDFRDWEGVGTFSVIASSADPDSNILEWGVAPYKSQLNLYARVEGRLMADGSAQRLTFFVDVDNSCGTGYLIGGVGADFMIELLGWDGAVFASPVSEFSASDDQLNWSLWSHIGSASTGLAEDSIEAIAQLPFPPKPTSRVIIASQNSEGTQCVSYPVVLEGGLLIVEQIPDPEIASSGVVPSSRSEEFLQLRFSCQGDEGQVNEVELDLIGIELAGVVSPFSITPTQVNVVDVVVDSSQVLSGQFVSATLLPSGVFSSFTEVIVTGDGARAYCASPPSDVSIDGAFGDWLNKTVADTDILPVLNPNINIDDVGTQSSSENMFFYLSVQGELLSGIYVPKECGTITWTGNVTVMPTRKTAEDYARVFVDSDRSDTSGEYIEYGTQAMGADYMIEISGVCGEIRTKKGYLHSSNGWTELDMPIQAAKDASRMEIGVLVSSMGDSDDVDFLVEMTDWRGGEDIATNDSVAALRSWIVESDAAADATSMSYQRKLFYDGTNFWSIYYDGDDTVYSYSPDGGVTWNIVGNVFSTSGVSDASIWYDSGNQLVYAIGDKTTPSQNVYLQRGSVSPGSHTITWAGSDSTQSVSTVSVGGKNTYICKDLNGYLWILSSRQTGSDPDKYDLAAYISDSSDSISSGWTESREMLSPDSAIGDLKGSILPAGSGSDVWAVYNHDSKVDAVKCTDGSWGSVENVYTDTGSLTFMNTAPASVVIDASSVVHVVFGDATKDGATENPHIRYRYRNSGGWADAIILDDDDNTVAHYYPTISLDSSTGCLYALWVQEDDNHIQCKRNLSGSETWSSVTVTGQTSYEKLYLTSIYSAPGENYVCWQWTQNSTGTIEVMFDKIPEFGQTIIPVVIVTAVFIVSGIRHRNRERTGMRTCKSNKLSSHLASCARNDLSEPSEARVECTAPTRQRL